MANEPNLSKVPKVVSESLSGTEPTRKNEPVCQIATGHRSESLILKEPEARNESEKPKESRMMNESK